MKLCPACGVELVPATGDRVVCCMCGWAGLGTIAPPRPATVTRGRRPRNWQHREDWRDRLGGVLRCGLCQAEESPLVQIDIHHVWELDGAGPDELWNTVPMCQDCHRIQQALRDHRLHAIGEPSPAQRGRAA